MIRLTRRRNLIPAKYRDAGLQSLLERLLSAWYDHQGDVPFNKVKSLQQWKEAKTALIAESSGKCAYCESPTAVNSYGDVEHFRPKDTYWWLAYSYDNYTFSCQLCNQRFKGAGFPVAGPVIKPPVALPKSRPDAAGFSALAAALCPNPSADTDDELRRYFRRERAHLPHPYLTDPETLFAWRVDDANKEVVIIARGTDVASRRAVAAVERYLGLNREELRRQRYVQYAVLHLLALGVQLSPPSDASLPERLEALRALGGHDRPYAAMSRHFLREWGLLP